MDVKPEDIRNNNKFEDIRNTKFRGARLGRKGYDA